MKFDYASTPAHPRKIMKIINQFVNENITLIRQGECLRADDLPSRDDVTPEEWLEAFANAPSEIYEFRADFIVKRGKQCAAWNPDETDLDTCEITMNFAELMTAGSIAVRENAVSRSKTLKGFSDLTFTILHEVGHFMTAEDVPENDDGIITFTAEDFLILLAQSKNELEFQREAQKAHYTKPSEMMATDWAINWLSNEDNRKRAKKFERDFFKAWRGE